MTTAYSTDLIWLIRAMYPNPVPSSIKQYGTEYCVGGAVCLFAGHSIGNFPSHNRIANALMRLNGNLSRNAATSAAHKIVTTNDSDRIEEAWETARVALKRGKT